MCGLWYKRDEMKKEVTLKMLHIVKTHLESRHVPLTLSLPKSTLQNRSVVVRICRICYDLATAEYTLMGAECDLARIQGIPASVDQLVLQASSVAADFVESKQVIDGDLYQWRTMVYLDTVENIPEHFMFMQKEYWIQYKTLGYSLAFPLDLKRRRKKTSAASSRAVTATPPLRQSLGATLHPGRQQYDKVKLKINKLRTFYFFSPGYDLDRFLGNESVSIRITDGESWDNYLAEGHANLFSECTCCDYVNTCLCYPREVLLFLSTALAKNITLRVCLPTIKS